MKNLLNDYRFELNRGMVWANEVIKTKNTLVSSNIMDIDLLKSQVQEFKSEVDLFNSLSRNARRNNIHKFICAFANLRVYTFLLSNA